MTLSVILTFALTAVLVSWLAPAKWKTPVFLIASLFSVYWLQPASTVRNLDFWLPSVAIILTILTWIVSQRPSSPLFKTIWPTLTIIALTILALAAMRYVEPICCLTASKPPPIFSILTFLLIAALLAWITRRLSVSKPYIGYGISLLIIGLLIILKSPALTEFASVFLRKMTGQDVNLASGMDISWLGFSYLSFRLLHVLQDSNSGRLGKISLGDFLVYALFFPSYTAGPIDRAQRFNRDLQAITSAEKEGSLFKRISGLIQSSNFLNGSKRILTGIFKKFVLADSLALIALNDHNVIHIQDNLWAWILIYAFSLRIYLDFAGYTDIAIGLGQLLGFKLPENFTQPYRKTNLTSFWNSWHITLSQWFRAYFFNPITRWLRAHPGQFPVWVIVLIGQLGTMLLIGLWHGISWNFAIWGLWHGLGLFIHNRWADWGRSIQQKLPQTKPTKILSTATSWFITFNYVSLGWVWFALSEPNRSISILQKLFSFQ
jgi:D-alanyl-lipoteichoic acid acyltransferase DltB (MBOAT superfamily)